MFRLLIVALLALLALAAAAVEVPYYGNNCGPGYTKGNPIDAADAACERHDWCYGSANNQGSEDAKAAARCNCDTDLMNSLQQIKNDGTYNGLSQEGKTAVDQMSTIFTYKCGVVATYNNLRAQYGK